MFKRLGLSLFAVVLTASFALGAGLWLGYPVVGNDGTLCISAGNNGVCNQFEPVGPSALTGNETVPADTNLPGNGSVQTVKIKLPSIGAGPYQYAAPLTGSSLTLTAQQRRLIVDPAGTIAALTVVFPAATGLVDNQTMGLCSTQIVTALTITDGAGATVLNKPTALTVPLTTGAASCVEWVYRLANTSWYRVQ